MTPETLFLAILLPVAGGIIELAALKRSFALQRAVLLFCTALGLWIAAQLAGSEGAFSMPWGGLFNFSLRLYGFSRFILLFVAIFAFLIALFSSAFMKDDRRAGQFFGYYLLTVGLANGAILANDVVVLLFFWEGLLLTLFTMIMVGRPDAHFTAIKALIINGAADLCMLAGLMLAAHLAGTTMMSQIHLGTGGLASVAFILCIIGALGKGGAMPFHSWIPDAAVDAPLPFMALLPGAFEKLLGIYMLSRISLDFFSLAPGSHLSMLLMIVGAITIVLAVLMALIQKDYKRLLSFHAISQVGYMILGIGTALPAGIVGGLFHMLNNAVYKSCLFLTGGCVESATGTTDLRRLGGLGRRMPWTCLGFMIAALSISGVPPFNGFFSKELIYDGALERGFIFYLAAAGGSFLTAASFLKLGHAAFFGTPGEDSGKAKEVSWMMLTPVLVLAAMCVIFGLYNSLPLRSFIQPAVSNHIEGHDFAGLPHAYTLAIVTILVLLAAVLNHLFGVKRSGSGLGAVDHIHYAPGFHSVYERAEKRLFDPYEIAMKIVRALASIGYGIDRVNDWFYNSVVPALCIGGGSCLRRLHNGSHATYLAWTLVGAAIIVTVLIRGS